MESLLNVKHGSVDPVGIVSANPQESAEKKERRACGMPESDADPGIRIPKPNS